MRGSLIDRGGCFSLHVYFYDFFKYQKIKTIGHTDDRFEIFPVMEDEFLVGLSENLTIDVGEVKGWWCLFAGHGYKNLRIH